MMKILNREITTAWVTENLTVILLVPTLLGGLWQLAELASIGVPYIRFFSVSQMVSDGLLMLFILGVIIYSSFIFINPALKYWLGEYVYLPDTSNDSDSFTDKKWIRKIPYNGFTKWISIFFILLALAGIAVAIFWSSGLINPFKTYIGDDRTTADSLFLFLSWFISGMVIVMMTIGSLVASFGYQLVMNEPRKRRVKGLFLALVIIVGFGSYRPVARYFHRSFHVSDNFKNIEYVKSKVLANNPNSKSWSFEYFNDQYLFIKITDSAGKEKIEVFEFDTLFANGDKKD